MYDLSEKFVIAALSAIVLMLFIVSFLQVRIISLHQERMDEIISSCIEVQVELGYITCNRIVGE